MTLRFHLLITMLILLTIAGETRSNGVATDPAPNSDTTVVTVDWTPPLSRAIDTTPPVPMVDLVDSGGLEPFVGELLPTRLRDIAEFGPMVPDPAPLAVFGIVLVLIGVSRRYLTA